MAPPGTRPGQPFPLGATPSHEGVNFSVWARDAAAVELLLFDRAEDARPSRVVTLDRAVNRSYHYWHVLVPDVGPGQLYGFRARGPFDPSRGMRFDGAPEFCATPFNRSSYRKQPQCTCLAKALLSNRRMCSWADP